MIETIETRAEDESQGKVIEGYINKFNTRSEYMGFYEQIDPAAFDRTLSDGHSILGLYNHNDNMVLGSTNSGSLQLSTDDIGLRFRLEVNENVSYAKDVYELVKRGDVEGCSFGFYALDERWQTLDDDSDLRTILDAELVEVTITPFPAYKSSQASVRSYELYKQQQEDEKNKHDDELRKRKLAIELELI